MIIKEQIHFFLSQCSVQNLQIKSVQWGGAGGGGGVKNKFGLTFFLDDFKCYKAFFFFFFFIVENRPIADTPPL